MHERTQGCASKRILQQALQANTDTCRAVCTRAAHFRTKGLCTRGAAKMNRRWRWEVNGHHMYTITRGANDEYTCIHYKTEEAQNNRYKGDTAANLTHSRRLAPG